MTEAARLSVLLLHLEMNPDELQSFETDEKAARDEMAHFGLSQDTIEIVCSKNLEEFAKRFPFMAHLAVGGPHPRPPKK